MKGPRSRHRFNVLRIWECPACGKRVFEPARVTHRACTCRGVEHALWMRLIELPPPYRRKPTAFVVATDASEPSAQTNAPST